MKNYHFKLKSDDPKDFKKKSFCIELTDDIDLYNMFEEAIDHVQNNYEDYFKLIYSDEYINFEIIRGKNKATCWLEREYCTCCGGDVCVGGDWDDDTVLRRVK